VACGAMPTEAARPNCAGVWTAGFGKGIGDGWTPTGPDGVEEAPPAAGKAETVDGVVAGPAMTGAGVATEGAVPADVPFPAVGAIWSPRNSTMCEVSGLEARVSDIAGVLDCVPRAEQTKCHHYHLQQEWRHLGETFWKMSCNSVECRGAMTDNPIGYCRKRVSCLRRHHIRRGRERPVPAKAQFQRSSPPLDGWALSKTALGGPVRG